MATQTYKGDKGDFEVSTKDNKFQVKFTPDKTKVDCKNIGFVQTAKAAKGGRVLNPVSALGRNFRHLDDDQTGAGTFVDHLSTEKDPFYNGDDLQDGGGGNRQGDATSDPVKPAQLTDAPNVPADEDVEVEFEVCAYCIGTGGRVDTSKSMGCVKVQFLQKKGKTGVAEPGPGDKAQPPSESHKEAVKKFEDSHFEKKGDTEVRKCPDTGLKDPSGIKNPIDFFDEPAQPGSGEGMKRPVDFESSVRKTLERFFAEKFGGAGGQTIRVPEVRAFAEMVSRVPHVAFLGYRPPMVAGVKLTNVGPQIKNLYSIVLSPAGAPVTVESFAPYRNVCVNYSSDEVAVQAAELSAGSLEGVAEVVLAADRGCPAKDAAVSATVLYRTANGTAGSEILLARDQVAQLLSDAFDATPDSEEKARRLLAVWSHTFSL